MKETITKDDIGQLSITEDEANIRHARKISKAVGMELTKFKKLIKVDEQPKCDQDMIKCSTCKKSMGIKKWARLATKKLFTCPGCGATAEAGTKVKVAFKEPSRFKIESVETGEASVETREDGTRLIKEKVVVKVKPVTKKN